MTALVWDLKIRPRHENTLLILQTTILACALA